MPEHRKNFSRRGAVLLMLNVFMMRMVMTSQHRWPVMWPCCSVLRKPGIMCPFARGSRGWCALSWRMCLLEVSMRDVT